jgi:hypothetical protein
MMISKIEWQGLGEQEREWHHMEHEERMAELDLE